jgi:hypothetical protein
MIGPVGEDLLTTARIAEFNKLRDEIASRSAHQHTLVGLGITAAGLLGALVAKDPRVLLVLPVVSSVCWLLWLDHHGAICRAGARADLLLKEVAGEGWQGRDAPPGFRDRTLFSAPLAVLFFLGPALALIALPLADDPDHRMRTVLWVAYGADCLLVALAGAFLISFLRER